MTTAHRFSVVIPTKDRSAQLAQTAVALKRQTFDDFEAVIVDDGSTDPNAVRSTVTELADPRFHLVRQDPSGPATTRNTGVAASAGDWIVYLDDDDEIDGAWLATLDKLTQGPAIGLVCCGMRVVDDAGSLVQLAVPTSLGPAYNDAVALFLAGSFAVRRDVAEAAGGHDPAITYGENFELGMRLVTACHDAGLGIRTTAAAPIAYVTTEQPITAARAKSRFESSQRLLTKHSAVLKRDRALRASTLGVAGVNAARLGLGPDARTLLWRAAITRPLHPAGWARLTIALIPPLSRRRWNVAPD